MPPERDKKRRRAPRKPGKSRGPRSSRTSRSSSRTPPPGEGRRKPTRSRTNGRSTPDDSGSSRTPHSGKRRRDLEGPAVDLPNWIVDALARVTAAKNVAPALKALGEASAAMRDGRYHAAVKAARRAKSLAPNDTTVRETLGLAAYRIGAWDVALSELRAYRRMAGDASHLPIEMDVLRAMRRDRDVETVWDLLRDSDVRPAVLKEGTVVYASYLLDRGDAESAWDLTGPERVGPGATEADLRVWYVAARAAARTGEIDTARRIADAIVLNDPGFAGLDELDREIAHRL